jgi:hypothetical protein
VDNSLVRVLTSFVENLVQFVFSRIRKSNGRASVLATFAVLDRYSLRAFQFLYKRQIKFGGARQIQPIWFEWEESQELDR